MKFKATREALLGPLQRVSGVIEKRQTLPILAHALIQLDGGGRLKLTGTDMEIQMTAEGNVETVEPGDITLSARKLLDVCRLLPDGAMITLDIREDKAIVTSGRSRYSMATMPAYNYPAFDGVNVEYSATVPANLLKRSIEKTQHAMAIGDVRYYLNGLFLDFDGQTLRTVASDGHRLALYAASIGGEKADPRQVIIPRKGVLELFKLLKDADEPVTLNFGPNTVDVETGEFGFSAKLIEGRYPDINRVMPRDLVNTITVNTGAIKAALARVSVLSEGKIKGISMAVKGGTMTLQTTNEEHDDALEELDVALQGDGLEVGFNAAYLLESLAQIDGDTVTLAFPSAANACLIQQPGDDSFKVIAMPMKL